MAIRWSAVKVRDAMSMVEEQADKLIEPMEQALTVVRAAREIPNLPDYMESHLVGLESEIERVGGGLRSWDKEKFHGCVHRRIESVLKDIPDGAIKQEEQRTKYGQQQSLVT